MPPRMQVVDHAPHAWFLLRDGDRYYFDARVSRSAVEWSVLVELTPQELGEYRARGKPCLDELAARIDDGAHADRDLAAGLGDRVVEAVRAWRATAAG